MQLVSFSNIVPHEEVCMGTRLGTIEYAGLIRFAESFNKIYKQTYKNSFM